MYFKGILICILEVVADYHAQGSQEMPARESAVSVRGMRRSGYMQAQAKEGVVQGMQWQCVVPVRETQVSVRQMRREGCMPARASEGGVQGLRWQCIMPARETAA